MNKEDYSENLIKQIDLIYYWEPFAIFTTSGQEPHRLDKKSLFRDFKKYLTSPFRKQSLKPVTWNKTILVGFDTLNQYFALQGIFEGYDDAIDVVSLHPKFRTHVLPGADLKSLGQKYMRQILQALLLFKTRDREVLTERYQKTLELLGIYDWLHMSMQLSKPELKYFIGANDHSGLSQMGFVAARNSGIKTIYIQHASVSDKYPPLRADFALLDGQDALDKYKAIGPINSEVHLVGASKYDAHLSNPKINTPGEMIGVCIGHVQPNHDDFMALCEQLDANQKKFCLRFHPAVPEGIQNKFVKRGWAFSNAKTENALDFILRCHTIISADSNILLEAILLKRRPIYLSHDPQTFDYYGFLKRNMLEGACYNAEEVLNMLEQEYDLEQYRHYAKHYQSTLYTEWEGRSSELVMKKLKAITGCAPNLGA